MNYLILLGLSLQIIQRISAQLDCTSLTCPSGATCVSYKFICDSTTGCEWDTEDTFCESNDGMWQQSCCENVQTSQNPTAQPSISPSGHPSDNPTGKPSVSPTRGPTLQSTATTPPPTTAETTSNINTTPQPSHRPTMQSALKWEMIHPAYDGGDGELLWHVYYGDFSNDERFDDFRRKEMWNIQELQTIMKYDTKFHEIEEKYEKSDAVLVDSGTETGMASKTGYGGWLIGGAMLAICVFVFWYKYKSDSSGLFNRHESKPLLKEKTVSDKKCQQIY